MQSAFIYKNFEPSSVRYRNAGLIVLFLLFSLFASSCAVAPIPEISKEERAQRDQKIGTSLVPKFEENRIFRKDVVSLNYLREIAVNLSASFEQLQEPPIRLQILSEKGWFNYSLPGNRLYLSSELLAHLRFENELAAMIALELGHLVHRNFIERFDELGSPKAPVLNQVFFQYSEQADIKALESAMQMLYRAGYDPRGMVTFLGQFEGNHGQSPYPKEILPKMIEKARRVIALQAPLRNPIVRSERFISIMERMRKL